MQSQLSRPQLRGGNPVREFAHDTCKPLSKALQYRQPLVIRPVPDAALFMPPAGTGRGSSACVCMAHDNLESPSGERVDLSDAEAIKRWRQIFGVTEEELRTAVGKAGTSPEKVREALRSRA